MASSLFPAAPQFDHQAHNGGDRQELDDAGFRELGRAIDAGGGASKRGSTAEEKSHERTNPCKGVAQCVLPRYTCRSNVRIIYAVHANQ